MDAHQDAGAEPVKSPSAARSKLSRQLETARVEKGLTKTQLAGRCGLSRTSASQAFSETARAPSGDTLAALAKVLGLRLDPLLALRETALEASTIYSDSASLRPVADRAFPARMPSSGTGGAIASQRRISAGEGPAAANWHRDKSGLRQMDIESVRSALRTQVPTAVLGLREGQWLEAKVAPHDLHSPRSVAELAKDVAAFANSGGGLLLLGVATRAEDGEEVIERIVSVDRSAVDLGRMRQLIRIHVTPVPRDVALGWCDDGQSRVVFIDIPEQPAGSVFVVAAPVGEWGHVSPHSIAIPMRESDGTVHWVPRTEIQRLLAAGIAASRMPGPQTLTDLVRQAVADAQEGASAALMCVGQGLPAREGELREAYEQLHVVADLGRPISEAYVQGASVLQHFENAIDSKPGWVICLVGGQQPVAVSEPVWKAVLDVGQPGPDGETTAAVGYPIADGEDPAVLGPDTQCVTVGGGRWGAGRVIRSKHGKWQWEPKAHLSLDQTRAARNWTVNHPVPQLRLRTLVSWPWADTRDLEITSPHRRDLAQALQFSTLTSTLTLLSRRRGAELPATQWQVGPHRNALDQASYFSTITAPDGLPALTATAMAALPSTRESNVLTCAEVLLQDATAWAAALPAGTSTQLSLDEVQAVLVAAWEIAADLLASAVTRDPAQMRWSAPPTVELRISAEGPNDRPHPDLGTLIDLSKLGPTDRGVLPEMAVTITTAPVLEHKERQRLLRRAFAYMVQSFGYVEADAERL